MVLRKVEPKNNHADNITHREGWTLSQLVNAAAIFVGRSLSIMMSVEIEGKDPSKTRLFMAHSTSQSTAMAPAKVRSNATFGTSTYAICAWDIT